MDDLTRRAREALADVTPGPWSHNTMGEFGPSSCEDDQSYGMICDPAGKCDWPNAVDNARFIAVARDLVPAMADRLEAQEALLRDAVEALRFYADEHCNGYLVWITDYGLATETGPIITDRGKRARATLAKLRAHLEETK